MGRAKQDLINTIVEQIINQLEPEQRYFDRSRPADVLKKVAESKDISLMNRIFDDIKLDDKTSNQLYAALMNSEDAVHDFLIPVLSKVSAHIFDPKNKRFHEDMHSFFARTEVFRFFLKEPHTLQKTMLHALGSAFISLTTDGLTKKIASNPEAGPDESEAFAIKVTIPCDAYLKTMTPQKLVSDAAYKKPNFFVRLLLRALLYIMSWFGTKSAQSKEQVDLSIEGKINRLQNAVNNAIIKIEQAKSDNAVDQEILNMLKKFNDNLVGLKAEIDSKKEVGMDYEVAANAGFDGLCKKFSERATAYVGDEEHSSLLPKDVLEIVNELSGKEISASEDAPKTPGLH